MSALMWPDSTLYLFGSAILSLDIKSGLLKQMGDFTPQLSNEIVIQFLSLKEPKYDLYAKSSSTNKYTVY